MLDMEGKPYQLPIVIDTTHKEPIFVETLNEAYEVHELHAIREDGSRGRYLCFKCNQPVILHACADNEATSGHRYHFQHYSHQECVWKTESTSRTEVYKGVKEGSLHQKMKWLLRDTLMKLPDWEVVDVDRRFVFSDDRLKKAKPDLHAKYRGENIVFEIQLRSEKPSTIQARKDFYRIKGWKLLWISAENSEIVSEQYTGKCIEVKAVQKDIAFTNRWNWFIFNTEEATNSLDEKKLMLQAVMWTPFQSNNLIEHDWTQEPVSFTDIQFENGEAFYKDMHALDANLRKQLRESGKANARKILANYKRALSWDTYLKLASAKWPSMEPSGSDGEWLHKLWLQDIQKRELQVKESILSFLRHPEWRKRGRQSWITQKLLPRVEGRNFGINGSTNANILEKLLLILGYRLSEHLCPEKSSHIQSCHNFFDEQHYNFTPYRDLCLLAIEKSVYREDILKHHTMVKRLEKPVPDVEQLHDHDELLEWFTSGDMPDRA